MAEEKEETEVTLRCGVYGEATVFPVKVKRDAEGSELQEAIARTYKAVSNRVEVYPARLTLYLARKKGETTWMKDDDNLDILLRGNVDKQFMKLRSSWRLNETELFGPSFTPKAKDIHVLVELPEAVVPAPTIESRSQTYRRSGIVRKERELEEEKEGKRKRTYSHQLDELLAIGEQLMNAKNRKVGTLLSTSSSIFGTALGNGLYIRQEYRDLYQMIKKKLGSDKSINRILVTGSPGIGKSVFGVLLLVDFMRKEKNVAYRPLGGLVTYYFAWDSVSGYEISDMPYHGIQYYGFFYGTEANGALVFSDFHKVFLFASPRTRNYNNFVKDNCFVVYLNPWTKDECRSFANVINLKDQDEWERRFNLVGGKPRFLFSSSHTYDDLVARVKADIPNTVADLKDQVRLFQLNVLKKGMKHILFNIYRDEKFSSQSYLAYSSLIVETMIGARYDIESADAIRSLLQTPAPNLQSWRGKQLEKFLLQDLATNKFCTRSLEGSDVGTVSQHGPFHAKSKIISALSDIQCELVLYIPLSKTFPALDSVLVVPSDRRIMYVQSTVSANHPIKYKYVKEAYEHLALRQEFQGYTHRLLFIVPDDTYDKFTVQPYQNMDGKPRKTSIDVDVTQFVGKIIRQ